MPSPAISTRLLSASLRIMQTSVAFSTLIPRKLVKESTIFKPGNCNGKVRTVAWHALLVFENDKTSSRDRCFKILRHISKGRSAPDARGFFVRLNGRRALSLCDHRTHDQNGALAHAANGYYSDARRHLYAEHEKRQTSRGSSDGGSPSHCQAGSNPPWRGSTLRGRFRAHRIHQR